MDIYEDHAKSLTDSVRLTRRGFAVTRTGPSAEGGHLEPGPDGLEGQRCQGFDVVFGDRPPEQKMSALISVP